LRSERRFLFSSVCLFEPDSLLSLGKTLSTA
jgi:hypothetical protein